MYLNKTKKPQGDSSLSRREFLCAGMMASVATGLVNTRSAGNSPARKAKVMVGAHPWVYAARQPRYDIYPILPAIFADMQFAGLEGIELMHTALLPEGAVDRIGELAQKHSLSVIGTSYGADMWDRSQHSRLLEGAELIITRLAKLGGRTLGTSVGAPPRRKTEEQLDAQADVLRKIMSLCKAHNVVLNLHNHTYEVIDNLHDLKGTLKRIPDIKLGPDLNWLVRGGVNPVKFLRQYGKQVGFLHLRDQKADGRWSEALGEGDMDYQAIAGALKEIDFQGDAVIELAHEGNFKPTRPLRDSLKISRTFVRKVLGF